MSLAKNYLTISLQEDINMEITDKAYLGDGREVTILGFDKDQDGSKLVEVGYSSYDWLSLKHRNWRLLVPADKVYLRRRCQVV